MPIEIPKNELPEYERSGLHCPQCHAEIPKMFFMRYIKSNYIRYFLFTFCLSFTLMTIFVDIRAHYSANATISFNPYYVALIFSGVFALIGWLSQKQNDFRKELAEKKMGKTNAES